MKENDDAQLNKLLQSWEVSQEAPVGFEREVWSRIAARPETSENGLAQLLEVLSRKLLRPQVVGAIGLVVLVASVGMGFHHAGVNTVEKKNRIEQYYILSIDPITHHQVAVQR